MRSSALCLLPLLLSVTSLAAPRQKQGGSSSAVSNAVTPTTASDAWMLGPFTRPPQAQPILTARSASVFADPILGRPVHWEALHTFNPAAILRDGKIDVLYRAEDDSGSMQIGMHTSRLALAVSDDGLHFVREETPVFYPAQDSQQAREWPGGTEDPRVVESPDGGYVLTYTQWNRKTYRVGIATSPDLRTWTKHGPAFGMAKYAGLRYKSAGIVTECVTHARCMATRIHGHYWMYWGEGEIHLATSDNLVDWTPVLNGHGVPKVLMRARSGRFDSGLPEVGPPPVLTKDGIVLIYNGKNAAGANAKNAAGANAKNAAGANAKNAAGANGKDNADANGTRMHGKSPVATDRDAALAPGTYSVGQALFAADNPAKLLARTGQPIFEPKLPWEQSGQYAAGTTFAEGLVWFHQHWLLYYGCADSRVGVAMSPDVNAASPDASR